MGRTKQINFHRTEKEENVGISLPIGSIDSEGGF
jgi:hypothetical protein